eukprot:CAMPEP_0177235438 /NCGR_PEP_ID=MMETSP0367-20130122/44927_1 /TAXON_ID=447022 ORGANISM="Scrippsiella hangoei-like, Strain SHHI-4" /NCGR_SAMPLE_ID=MMETSP0367 /ASSEMBLY_ACC=CAM_ASM_000362 /LENGTH=172 /DNA_ID=CAMNT_0018686293 /DNA_START=62 /DNA_END=576 /DNA_ORIENTATION=+
MIKWQWSSSTYTSSNLQMFGWSNLRYTSISFIKVSHLSSLSAFFRAKVFNTRRFLFALCITIFTSPFMPSPTTSLLTMYLSVRQWSWTTLNMWGLRPPSSAALWLFSARLMTLERERPNLLGVSSFNPHALENAGSNSSGRDRSFVSFLGFLAISPLNAPARSAEQPQKLEG